MKKMYLFVVLASLQVGFLFGQIVNDVIVQAAQVEVDQEVSGVPPIEWDWQRLPSGATVKLYNPLGTMPDLIQVWAAYGSDMIPVDGKPVILPIEEFDYLHIVSVDDTYVIVKNESAYDFDVAARLSKLP